MASDAKAELLAHGFSAEVVLAVIDHVLYQPTKVLERIRPYALADAWGMDRQEVLAVLLQAANRGVVDLAWDLICPRCLVSHESFPALSRIERSGVCLPCNRAYERDLRESVELVFRPHPALREAEPTTYCAGAPALRPHILAQQSLPPGEERVFRLELPSDEYRVVASHVREPFAFSVSTVAFGSELSAVIEEGLIDSRPSIVKTGTVRISIVNNTEHDQIVRVEEARGRADRVTAADVLSTPSFRDLFSQEMLAEGEHMSVSRMAFLFVDIEGRQDLLASHGDAGAWAILRTLDRELDAHAREHEGTLVASSLDARIAAFNTTLLALKAALSLTRHAAISESLKVAVHDGQCLALTRTGRTEYFGKTLHRGVALLDEATAGKVALSATAAGDRAVATYLEAEGLGREVATTLGGPYNGTRVVKVSVSAEDSVRTPAA
jgi:class 3 adenylate cyclase